MRGDRRPIVTPQLVFGLLLIVAGVFFLLDNLGLADAARYVQYWPAALIVVGLAKVLQARSVAGWLAGIGWTIAGLWILGWNQGWIHTSFWRALRTYWPVLLMLVGLSVVWRTVRRTSTPETDARNMLSLASVLGGTKRTSNAPAFRGGEFTALLGGVEIDLRHATMGGAEAVVDVFAMWGGVVLRVPEGWVVESQVSAFLGGVEEKTRPVAGAGAPCLVIRGIVIMGGLEVTN